MCVKPMKMSKGNRFIALFRRPGRYSIDGRRKEFYPNRVDWYTRRQSRILALILIIVFPIHVALAGIARTEHLSIEAPHEHSHDQDDGEDDHDHGPIGFELAPQGHSHQHSPDSPSHSHRLGHLPGEQAVGTLSVPQMLNWVCLAPIPVSVIALEEPGSPDPRSLFRPPITFPA